MLAKWTQILPVFVFKWLARRNCELICIDRADYRTATQDVLIREPDY